MVSQEGFAIIAIKKESNKKSFDFIARNVILIYAKPVRKQKDIKYKVLYRRLINRILVEIIILLKDCQSILVLLIILEWFVMIVGILSNNMKKKDSIAKIVIMISALIATMALKNDIYQF